MKPRVASAALALCLLTACASAPQKVAMAPASPEERQRAQELRQEEGASRAQLLKLLGTQSSEEDAVVEGIFAQGGGEVKGLDSLLGGSGGVMVGSGGGGSGGLGGLVGKRRQQRATVQALPPQITGGQTSRMDIFGITNRRLSAARYCYERQLDKDPNLKGSIRLRFTIGAQGRVTQIQVLDNSVQSTVGACLLRVVERTRFTAPANGQPEVEVEQQWIFKPR